MKYFTYNQNPEPASPSVLPNRALGSWLQGSLQLQQTEADLDKMGERRKCPFAFSVKLLSLLWPTSSKQYFASFRYKGRKKQRGNGKPVRTGWQRTRENTNETGELSSDWWHSVVRNQTKYSAGVSVILFLNYSGV